MTHEERKLLLISSPGDTIAETLDFMHMELAAFSKRMMMPPADIDALISGDLQLTPGIAIRLEIVLGIDTQFWLNREQIYRQKIVDAEKNKHGEEQ